MAESPVTGDEQAPDADPSTSKRTRSWVGPVAMLAAVAAGLAARLWLLRGLEPQWLSDSREYLASSRLPWGSSSLWAGSKILAVPVLLKVVGGNGQGYVRVQVVITVLCWGALAGSLASVMRAGWPRWIAVAGVVALSLTTPITMWDDLVLSEALAISGLVLVVALALQVVRHRSWPWVAALLGGFALWSTTRDTNLVIGIVAGVAVLVAIPWAARRDRIRLAVLGVGLVVVAIAVILSSDAGGRGDIPLANVYAARVLPYPDRVEWFAAHGMPGRDHFLATIEASDFVDSPGNLSPVVAALGSATPAPLTSDDGFSAFEWLNWMHDHGRSTFLEWIATHPAYLVTEPRQRPERIFSYEASQLVNYEPAGMRHVPYLTDLAWPPTALAIAAVVALVVWRRRDVTPDNPAALVGLIVVLLAGPPALVAWHADANEAARHLLVPDVQLRVGLLVLVMGLVGGSRRLRADAKEHDEPVEPASEPANEPVSPDPESPDRAPDGSDAVAGASTSPA